MIKKLTEEIAVSGNEKPVRDIIYKEIEDYVDNIKIDSMGNMIAYKKGTDVNGKNIMLSAHMDEVGFIITKITDKGYLKFNPVGGIDERIMLSKKVLIGNNKVKGVTGLKAVHLQSKQERKTPIKVKDMYIDIGTSSKDEAKKLVNEGDYVGFDSEYIEFGDHLVKAKALDDRAGCSIIIDLLKNSYSNNIYACFTVQEEVGLRGAETISYSIDPDIALIVEGTTSSDVSDVKEHEFVTTVGKGPALSIMDRTTFYNKQLNNIIYETAKNNNISIQYKKGVFGGNDAGKLHLSKGGIKTASLSIPCRYIHSPVSVMSMKDYEATYNLIDVFLNNSLSDLEG